MKNFFALNFGLCALGFVLFGCGGQSGSTGGGSFGSIGSVSFDIVGTAQTPVNRTSSTVSFSGVAGASFSGLRYNDYNTQPILFSSDENGIPSLFAMTQKSALRTPLLDYPTFLGEQVDPYPFPNGQSYAFSYRAPGGVWQLRQGFYGNIFFTQALPINTAFNDEQPCVAPNTEVFFVSDADGNQEIWKVNPDGIRSKITNTAPGISNRHPHVSSDGAWLVYQSNKAGNNEIYAFNFLSATETRLTTNAADDIEPTISPDQQYVVFASNRAGNYNIYRANLRTGGLLSQLTTDGNDDREPIFTPDGTKILFTSNRDDTALPVSTEIYSMSPTGGTQTRISVDSSYSQKSPVIAPYLSAPMSANGFSTICSGIISAHNNQGLVSFLQFEITSPTDANRGLTRVSSETLPNPAVPVIYYTISTPTSIASIRFHKTGTSLFPSATNLTPVNTATDALITYSASGANAGQVMAILPYSANRSPLRKRVEGGSFVVEGSFPEVYDADGKNIAPAGASVVKFDGNGQIVSIR